MTNKALIKFLRRQGYERNEVFDGGSIYRLDYHKYILHTDSVSYANINGYDNSIHEEYSQLAVFNNELYIKVCKEK